MSPTLVYLALGSNLGDRAAYLARGRQGLAGLPGSRIVAASAVEETLPLGGRDQPAYLNQMILLETTLDPDALLAACRTIEAEAGRTRGERWESRTLDIDIVRFGDLRISRPGLTIPHPGLPVRDFWQREIRDIEHQTRTP